MSEPKTDSRMLVQLSVEELREIVRAELQAMMNGKTHAEPDRLLTPEQAAEIMGGDSEKQVRWLYRHSKQLPFTRRISRKVMRFSESGLRRWIAARK